VTSRLLGGPHAALAFAFLVSGCSSGSDPDPSSSSTGMASGTTGGAGGGGGGEVSCEPDGAADVPDVAGRFAYHEVTSRLVVAPGFADPFHTRVVSVMLVDQTQAGEAIGFDAQYCQHYTEDPDAAVHVIIPEAFVAGMPPFSRTGTYVAAGGSHTYALPKFYQVQGVTLGDVPNEALPTAPDDPRVVDQDADGKPGMTLRLTGLVDGELYVVQRQYTEILDGGPVSADALKGPVGFVSEQVILESDPPSLKDLASDATTDPSHCVSYFEMARVPDDADCAYVNENFATLFP
jgi:hypothetical protein